MLAASVTILYAISVRWGACLKTESGWYGGLWAGRFAIGYSQTAFMSPGLETGKFAVPFSLGFHRDTDGSRWIVGLPLWSILLVILPGIARRWWRYAVFRTIKSRHPRPVAAATPHPADSPAAALPTPSGP
jgi:hypothetical protein